ncbi:MAG: type I restriction endonuclease subunit R [Verrucomicrobia bacterium]|nr:type I restriction endonuclease subunit R [Verrucomicrobiota bacterium]MCH8510777.1 type I restriction endonuclease subunit R [Kiritimatiellia bacterium]
MQPFNEDNLVQQTTADYLESALGWRSVFAFNHEVFLMNPHPRPLSQREKGDTDEFTLADGKVNLGRTSDREVVLTRSLRSKLEELNPGLPAEAYEDAVREVVTVSSTQSLEATNREKYGLIRDGVQVGFKNAKGERQRERLRLMDFEDPSRNEFLCVRELWVRGDLYRRRADIVGFVNGLPLMFLECKNVSKDLRVAYERNYKDYLDVVPHLFHHNAMVVLANGIDAKIGALGSPYKFFSEWKRLAEDEPGVVHMETLLKGVCEKRNFLDLLENFILFDESLGKPKKILARNHQFLGVNRAVEAVRNRKALEGKLGVFWHTQGSGKSFSMVMFTRKVHRKLGGNFTFLVLTDREDLDTQIYKTFAGCGVVDHDRNPCRASSGQDLGRLLAQHKSHVFSLIQKFNQELGEDEAYTLRDDVITITDEAHRTQYGTLALNLRNALPNASYIGFTGTPLFKEDEITRRVFGDYVSTYDFQRAVEDKATVPLYYDARGDKLGITVGDLDERIAAKLEELGTQDIDEVQRLEKELKRDYHIITAGKRLSQVAEDFVSHYSTAWESGKAMMVCIDKITCLRMHKLISFFWDERVRELERDLANAEDEQDALMRERQIEWMRKTRVAVVVSEEQGEVEKFRKWDLDILPHRRLMKEGMDLPETLRNLPEFRNLQRLPLEDAFKEERHPFRIVIVCAMWLTGFDVPCLSTLYLDKPLKAHTLMQAIARANRVNEGKNNGLIVDYCGILKNLRKALATFAGTGDDGRGGGGGGEDPARPGEELLAELAEGIALVRDFLEKRGAALDDLIQLKGFERNAAILRAKEAVNENDETRKRFEVMCRTVFGLFKSCITVQGVNEYRHDYQAIQIIYKSLMDDRDHADITDILRQLHAVVDEAIDTTDPVVNESDGPYDISKIDFDRLRREFERSKAKRTTVQSLKVLIEKRLMALLQRNPMRTDFQRHYEEIVADYNREKDRITIEKTFDDLMRHMQSMDEEESRAAREGLDEETLAIFDLLKKPDLNAREIQRIKAVARELLDILKEEKLRVDHWTDKEATRDAVRQTIHDFLWDEQTGLPDPDYDETDIESRAAEVFRHVFRVYPTLPSPFYGGEAA